MNVAPPTVAATLSDFIALVEPEIRKLAEARSLGRVAQAAGTLPASCFAHVGFERRLGDDDRSVDFSLSLTATGLRNERQAGRWPQLAPLLDLCSTLLPRGDAVWLEFDTSNSTGATPRPNVFLPLERTRGVPILPRSAVAKILATLSESDARLDVENMQAALERWSDALPASVSRAFIGFMLARTPATIRLCAMPLSGRDALTFLDTLGWNDAVSQDLAMLEPYEDAADFLCLHVDAAGSPNGPLGFELLYDAALPDMQPNVEPRWRRMFDLLVRQELCSPSERANFLGWPSATHLALPLFDRIIAAAANPDARVLHGTLRTCLHHVKIIFRSGGPFRAKCYFGIVLDTPKP